MAVPSAVMAGDQEPGPPDGVTLELDEALELLDALEDVRATFIESRQLAGLMLIEVQIRMLSRRLGFDEGGPDGDDF